MPTTGIVNAKLLTFYKGVGSPTPVQTAIACATEATINFEKEMRETTCKESGDNRTYLPSFTNMTGSFSGLFAYDATNYNAEDIYDDLAAGTLITVRFSTQVTGDTYWQASAYVTSLSISSGQNGENVTYSGNLQFTGAITKAVVS